MRNVSVVQIFRAAESERQYWSDGVDASYGIMVGEKTGRGRFDVSATFVILAGAQRSEIQES